MERTHSPSKDAGGGREGRSRAELLELVEKHAVRYTVTQNQVVTKERELVRHGWAVEIYASRAPEEMKLSSTVAIETVHDVLEDVMDAVLPESTDAVRVQVEPFIGRVFFRHDADRTAEVRARILIEPLSNVPDHVGAKEDCALLDALRERLADLGVVQGS